MTAWDHIRPREPTPWMKDAACRDRGLTHLFFPTTADGFKASETAANTAAARLICSGCPVREECRDYAVRQREPCGVWGGLSTQQRLGRRKHGVLQRGTPA